MNTKKAAYRYLCEVESSIPVFSRAWWLDAVAGEENWDVAIVERDGNILASMPYVVRKRLGFTLLVQPPLTKIFGPWIRSLEASHARQLSQQYELIKALIAQLPAFDHCSHRWHYSQTNWLPFYWAGFSQTTHYTYVIDDLSNLEAVFSGFSLGKRKDIKKAEKKIQVRFDISAQEFYESHKMTLSQANAKISYSYDMFKRIYDAGYTHDSARTIAGYDEEGQLHAALFIIWDPLSAYDLISTIDHRFRNSGASTLLVREAIRYAAEKTKKFDFEGSMAESVEHSFRQFNTKQVPYFVISKTPSKLYAAHRFIQSLRWGI